MTAGLFRLGADFGNGYADAQFFQRDRTAPSYRHQKLEIFRGYPQRLSVATDEPARAFQRAALAWMEQTLLREHPDVSPAFPNGARESRAREGSDRLSQHFRDLSLVVQEDFTLMMREASGDRLVLLSVCFPSGWCPERLLGRSFREVHATVPDFDAVAAKSAQLIAGIVERGPYVRFVWTLTADSVLDHHPEQSPRTSFDGATSGYLRVERQVTVPFPEYSGSLFLIRTYLYPFAELDPGQRAVVREAVRLLPDSIRAYKGLPTDVSGLCALLA